MNIEQNLKNMKMVNFASINEENNYKKALILINRAFIDLITSNQIVYDYHYLDNRTKNFKLVNSDLLDVNEEESAIHITQYNQLNERLDKEKEIINLTHEYLHLVCLRNYNEQTDMGNSYYGFDEFCTEFITSIIITKLGLNNYYQKMLGYIDEFDYYFMKKISDTIGFNVLLKIYFTGDTQLLKETLDHDLLSTMNEYLDYYLEVYKPINKPADIVNAMLKEDNYKKERETLDTFILKMNQILDNMINNDLIKR